MFHCPQKYLSECGNVEEALKLCHAPEQGMFFVNNIHIHSLEGLVMCLLAILEEQQKFGWMIIRNIIILLFLQPRVSIMESKFLDLKVQYSKLGFYIIFICSLCSRLSVICNVRIKVLAYIRILHIKTPHFLKAYFPYTADISLAIIEKLLNAQVSIVGNTA